MAEATITQKEAHTAALGLSHEIAPRNMRMQALEKSLQAHNGREGLEGLHGFSGSGRREETAQDILLTGIENGKRTAYVEPGSLAPAINPEMKRRDDVNAQTELYLTFIQEGYDKLSDAQKTTFRNQILEAINRNPNLQRVLGEVNMGAQRATLDRLVADDEIRVALAEILGTAYSQDTVKAATEIEKRLLATNATAKAKDAEVQALKTEHTRLDTEKVTINTDLKSFKEDGITVQVGGVDIKFDSREKALIDLQKTAAVRNYLHLSEQVQILRNAGGKDKTKLHQAENDLATAALDSEVHDFVTFYSQKQELEKKLAENSRLRQDVTRQLPVKEAEQIAAQHEYATARSEREALAKDFHNDVMHAVQNATEQVLVSRAKRVSGISAEILNTADSEVDKKAKEKLIQHVEKRWDVLARRSRIGKEEIRLNKTLAQADYQALMRDGPSGLARRIIDTTDLTTEEKEHLKHNSDFLAKSGVDLAEKTLAMYITTGGNFSDGESAVLSQKDWGEGAFQKWVDNNPQAKSLMEKLKATNKSNGKLEDLHKRFGGKFVAALILALLGIVTFAVAGPVMAAAAGSAGGEIMKLLGNASGSISERAGGLGSFAANATEAVSQVDGGAMVSGAQEAAAQAGDNFANNTSDLQAQLHERGNPLANALQGEVHEEIATLAQNPQISEPLASGKEYVEQNPLRVAAVGAGGALAVNRLRK
jgi:hypothetical protein